MRVPNLSVMSQVCDLEQDRLDTLPKKNVAHTSPVSKCGIVCHNQNYE